MVIEKKQLYGCFSLQGNSADDYIWRRNDKM